MNRSLLIEKYISEHLCSNPGEATHIALSPSQSLPPATCTIHFHCPLHVSCHSCWLMVEISRIEYPILSGQMTLFHQPRFPPAAFWGEVVWRRYNLTKSSVTGNMNISQNLLQPWNVRTKRPKIVFFDGNRPWFSASSFFFGDVAPCVKRASQILFGKIQTEFLCSQNDLKHPLFFWYGNHSLTDKDKTHPKTLIKTILQIPTLGRCVFKNLARTSFQWKVTFQHHECCEDNLNLSQPGTSTSLADYDYMTPPP